MLLLLTRFHSAFSSKSNGICLFSQFVTTKLRMKKKPFNKMKRKRSRCSIEKKFVKLNLNSLFSNRTIHRTVQRSSSRLSRSVESFDFASEISSKFFLLSLRRKENFFPFHLFRLIFSIRSTTIDLITKEKVFIVKI